jgi:rod shape-determining protein MreC
MDEALEHRKTIAQYEALKSFYAPPDARPLNAFVIGDSNEAYTHAMLVNVGAGKGVARGQAVLDDRGLVGRVVDTGKAASRILLLTDAQSRVPVFIEDANLEGILVGRANARPTIKFTLSSEAPDFKKGQRVLTSGAGGVVPRGLPVGVIVDAQGGEAIIDLYADYARARLVRVVNYEFPKLEPEAPAATPAEGSSPASGEAGAAATLTVLPTTPPAPAPADPSEDEPTAPATGTAAPAPPAQDEGD